MTEGWAVALLSCIEQLLAYSFTEQWSKNSSVQNFPFTENHFLWRNWLTFSSPCLCRTLSEEHIAPYILPPESCSFNNFLRTFDLCSRSEHAVPPYNVFHWLRFHEEEGSFMENCTGNPSCTRLYQYLKFVLTGRRIKSCIVSEVSVINLSATIFVPWDAKIWRFFSTEATTTSTLARRNISGTVTTSISSQPLAIGIKTCSMLKILKTISQRPDSSKKWKRHNKACGMKNKSRSYTRGVVDRPFNFVELFTSGIVVISSFHELVNAKENIVSEQGKLCARKIMHKFHTYADNI